MVDLDFDRFIQNPSCLWDLETTKKLVQLKWAALKSTSFFSHPSEYNTASILSKKNLSIDRLGLNLNSDRDTYIESFTEEYLGDFYSENDLTPLANDKLSSEKEKLKSALTLLDYPGGPLQSISLLVRSIHLVKQEDPEIDISHSDPSIPFSIFVSVCNDVSPISNLRVAESILHEAMHLKLTLLEAVIPLVQPFTGNSYFSPWREDKRPAQGVLHGLFVFRAIFDFIDKFIPTVNSHSFARYLAIRKEQIANQINQLRDFPSIPDLTEYGASLSNNLLPLN